MPSIIKEYVFVPSGETVRAAEVAVAIAVARVGVTMDWTQMQSWHTYAMSLAGAAVVAFWAFIKGRMSPS